MELQHPLSWPITQADRKDPPEVASESLSLAEPREQRHELLPATLRALVPHPLLQKEPRQHRELERSEELDEKGKPEVV